MHRKDDHDPPSVIIGTDAVEFVTTFVYLDLNFSNTGDHLPSKDVGWLQVPSETSGDHYSGITTSPDAQVTGLLRYRRLCASIRRVDVASQHELRLSRSRVYGFEPSTLRTIEWFDLVSNEDLLWTTCQPNIPRTINQRRVRWHEHVLRRSNDRHLKFDRPNRRWPRGRTYSRWKDVICQDCQLINLAIEDWELEGRGGSRELNFMRSDLFVTIWQYGEFWVSDWQNRKKKLVHYVFCPSKLVVIISIAFHSCKGGKRK